MIVDDRYDRWDRCDRWKHLIAAIVTIAEVWFPYSRWDHSDRRTHTIAVIVTIVAIAVLWFPYDRWDRYDRYDHCSHCTVVSINFLRSLTIVHDCYDRRDRLWFYPSDRDRCDRWQSLGSLAIAGKMKIWFPYDCYDRWTLYYWSQRSWAIANDHMETRLYTEPINRELFYSPASELLSLKSTRRLIKLLHWQLKLAFVLSNSKTL